MSPVFRYEFYLSGLCYRAYLTEKGFEIHRPYDRKSWAIKGNENSGLGRIKAALKKHLRGDRYAYR